MFTFTDDERAGPFKDDIRADGQGRDYLVGLTHDQTARFFGYVRRQSKGDLLDNDALDDWLDLDGKYQAGRIAVVAAENEIRVDKPTRH